MRTDARGEQAFLEVAAALVDDFDVVDLLTVLSERCVEVLDVTTATFMLLSPGGDLHVIARSGEADRSLERTEVQFRHGPNWDCLRAGAPIVDQQLSELGERWERFAPAALDAGFHSAHAVPLRLRGATFGALSFLRVDDVGFSPSDVAMAQAFADVAVVAIVQHSAALEVEDVEQQLVDAVDTRVLIDQAASVVAQHDGGNAEPAFEMLRNHARSNRFRLVDVAVDVVSGALAPSTVTPPRPRRRASDGAGRIVDISGATHVATKATIAVLSQAVEEIAQQAGPDATVLALFQRGPYLASRASVYTALAASGATVVTAFAGSGPLAAGTVHVPLDDDDALTGTWSVVVLTRTAAAYVVAHDLDTLGPVGRTLEDRRQFAVTCAFDRAGAAAHARTILAALGERLPPATGALIAAAITRTEVLPAPPAERALERTAVSLAGALEVSQGRVDAASERAERALPSASRDRVTGLMNREGLDRWLGGAALDGLDMPPVGLVMIGLDRVGALGGRRNRTVGDRLLKAMAAGLAATTRPEDVVVRWGFDEFIVLCAGVEGDELTQVARRLVTAVSEATVDGVSVAASASVQVCRDRRLPISAAIAALSTAKLVVGGSVVAIGSVA